MTTTTLQADDDDSSLCQGEPAKVLSAAMIKAEALDLGFSACGLAKAEPIDDERARLRQKAIAEGRHGEMHYLAQNVDKRLDPRLLFPGVKTIVSVALNYYHRERPKGYRLARYAMGKDYHDIVKHKLQLLAQRLQLSLVFPSRQTEEPATYPPMSARVFVDTAPVDERYWAWKSGLGWIGRSGMLILPKGGTHFFLGELMICSEVDEYDQPMASQCGDCQRCIKACPGKALLGDGTMDARRCLSYLTIEQKGELPEGTGKKMGNCIYGCDICTEVCPWNREATPTQIEELKPSPDLLEMTKEDWQQLSVEQYRKLFKGSAVKRAKYEGLMRNIKAVSSSS